MICFIWSFGSYLVFGSLFGLFATFTVHLTHTKQFVVSDTSLEEEDTHTHTSIHTREHTQTSFVLFTEEVCIVCLCVDVFV